MSWQEMCSDCKSFQSFDYSPCLEIFTNQYFVFKKCLKCKTMSYQSIVGSDNIKAENGISLEALKSLRKK